MDQLSTLQSKIARLRLYRSGVRVGAGLCVVAAVLGGGLLLIFGLDLWLGMGWVERLIAEVAGLSGVGYCLWKFLWPALTTHEDQASLAMSVEANHGINSDLIAAFQFNDPARAQHGSSTLRSAVVDYVDELGNSLDVMEGFDTKAIKRRALILGAVALVWLAIGLLAPDDVGVFAQRLGLAYARYPTRTQITKIVSPGKVAPFGQPVGFAVRLDGVLPDNGRVEIDSLDGGEGTNLTLKPGKDQPTLYAAKLKKAFGDLRYRIFAGDDYTRVRTLRLTPPANVDLNLDVDLPDYAKGKFEVFGDNRRLTVLEGSRVTVKLTSDKPLRSVRMTIGDHHYPLKRTPKAKAEPSADTEQSALNRAGDAKAHQADAQRKPADVFTLTGDNSPLNSVQKTTRFDIQATDKDGLSLAQPVTGVIRVRPDQPPRITAKAVSRLVLARATPQIHIQTRDAFGLSKIVLHQKRIENGQTPTNDADTESFDSDESAQSDELQANTDHQRVRATDAVADKDASGTKSKAKNKRESGTTDEPGNRGADKLAQSDTANDGPNAENAGAEQETGSRRVLAKFNSPTSSFDQRIEIPLAPMNLHKGDRVEVVVEAFDARGSHPAKSNRSSPITFEITDRSGLLDSMRDDDTKLNRKLESIIDKQLEIGDAK